MTYEEAVTRIGVLPQYHPRPNSKNLRAMMKALVQQLQAIPSYQSQRYGYMGSVTTAEEYALIGEQPWADYPDPGYHRPLGGNAAQQRDTDVQFNVAPNIYNSQENVRQTINNALIIAVPEIYIRAQGDLGPEIYAPMDDLRPY